MKSKADVMKDLAKVLRRTVTIQKKQVTYDDLGQPVETWADWRLVRAERSSLWGGEYYAARVVNEESTVVFTLRYVPFLDQINTLSYRLLYEGQAYDVKHIDPLKDDGMWLKVRAIRRGAND